MTSRILLADDSITIQKVVNLTFADEGIEVVAVSNGEQAERRLSEICPDLVLADIFMPGKNGYELCEFVKQSPQFRHVPVVLLVGAFEPFNEAEARRVRADAHLTKPFESRTLVDTVRKLIGMSGKPVTGALPSEPLRGQQDTPAPEASSVALPSFNLDLSEMAPDWESAQPAAQQQNSFSDLPDVTPLNNASPLELDYGAFGNHDSAPTGFQMEVEERASSAGFSFVSSVKDTAELPPLELEQQGSSDAAPWGQIESSQPQPAFSDGEPASGTGDSFGAPFEVPGDIQGFKVRSTFQQRGPDSVLDFDKLDAPQSPAPDNIVSFDVDFSTPPESDAATAYGAHAAQPSAGATDAQNPPTELSEEFGEVPFRQVQQTTPQPLSIDDPLGDVLSVEPSEVQPVEHGVNGGMAVFPQLPTEPAGSFSTRGNDDAAIVSQFPFDTEAAGGPTERPGKIVHSGLSFGAFSPVFEEPAPARAEPSGWEGGGSNDVLSELVEPADAPPREAENAFTASEMWAVAETEFAAIDIEAVAIEEPPSIADFGESPDGETGFAFASVADAVAETPAIIEAPKSVGTAVAGNAQAPDGFPLSPALIDEIVRRVIAEMGDAVVREIAWEVVPDCVERVVQKLSHEAAAKRM